MKKKKNAIMLADTRSALVGDVLIQLQKTNPGLFDEAIIYYDTLSDSDRAVMSSIMPCRFVNYSPPLSEEHIEKERFRLFSAIMFARYEMYRYLQEFETVTWLDTDILIQGDISGLIEEGRKTGFALVREDDVNKTDKKPDRMRTCFTAPLAGYDMEAYLYCSGTVVLTDKLVVSDDYTAWCYRKTEEWADILSLPDQGVLNAFVQEFHIPVTPLNGSRYCCFPYYGRDCSQAAIIHAWGVNKFWNDWYLRSSYPFWKEAYDEWVGRGGSGLPGVIAPKISVVIPVYKPNLKTFRQCIDSLIGQMGPNGIRYSDFEIIVVSEPFNQEEIGEFVESLRDPRIRLVFNEKRLGIAASLNRGISMAQGEYIARMDDDDLCGADRLYKQMKYLDSHQDKALCTSDFHYFGDMNQKRVSFDGEMARAWSIFTCPFDHPTVMFRRGFFVDNDLFYDETRGYVEDWELWLRAFDKGMAVGCIHEVLFYHRWHNGSAGQADKTIRMMQELIRRNFQGLGVALGPEDLPLVGPWNGKVSNADYERLERIFDEALSKNTVSKKYDQKCLLKVFSLRLKEAKTGTMPEICFPLADGREQFSQQASWEPEKPGLFRRILKKILKPLYRPIRHRFEDRLIHTEELTGELLTKINELQPTVSTLKKQQDDLADLVRESHWDLRSNLQSVNAALHADIREQESAVSEILQVHTELAKKVGGLSWLADGGENPFPDFVRSYFLSNCFLERKIFLIGTPDHDNIGDAAITAGTYEFIKKYFSGYKVMEITGYQIEKKFALISATISTGDLIFLQGGGNLGNMYLIEENIRRKVISNFPENKVVILPQTIYFDDTENGKKELALSAEIYGSHPDLTLFTRGEQSLAFAQSHFPGVKAFSAPDMALMLDRRYRFDRKEILLCIRDLNDESGLDANSFEAIRSTVAACDPDFEETQNRYVAQIPPALRGSVVNEQLQKFARHKIVVTDRLHGLLFSVITHTPCVVVRSYTQKIEEFVGFFRDSNAVSYVGRDIGRLEEEIGRMMQVETPEYPLFQEQPFDKIREIILK